MIKAATEGQWFYCFPNFQSDRVHYVRDGIDLYREGMAAGKEDRQVIMDSYS